MSDSVYSAEEKDIEEAENRATITPSQFTLPPLNLDRVDTRRNSKRESKRESKAEKRKSKRDSKRELKRTSERDPTPYFHLAADHEHGGKENASSSYNLGHRSTPARSDAKGKGRVLSSPERPKPVAARHSRAMDARKSQANPVRTSKAVTRQESTKERHSRKSIHSRTQSRHSTGVNTKKARAHSRSQSSAYPFFDASSLEPANPRVSASAGATLTAPPSSHTKNSLITRDLSGNLTFYAADEEPTIEELDSSSIAFRTSNGQISPTARQSRLASLHLSSQPPAPLPPPKSTKRVTAIPRSSESTRTASLGFFPHEMAGDEKRERGGKGKVEQGEGVGGEGSAEIEAQGRKTWGSLRTVLGRSSRWVSGGYWDRQGKEEKVFI